MVYREQKPRQRGKKPPKKPKLSELLPDKQMNRAAATWAARLDGVSAVEVYTRWGWAEMWETIAVHLALLKSDG